MSFIPAGLATGIGSLPFTDPARAVSVVLEYLPEAPHWPQLPGRGEKEGLVHQFLTPLVRIGLVRIAADRVFFDTGNEQWPEKLAAFYTLYMEAVEGSPGAMEQFALPYEAASGFYAFEESIKRQGSGEALYYKGHLAGPVTIGLQLKDGDGRFSYYDRQLRDVLVKTLALHSRWQALRLAALGRPAIVFIDEPGINVYGKSDFITINREMIIADLDEISEQVHAAGGLSGVHSCDAADWSILFDTRLDIVNLDAYNFSRSLIPFTGGMRDFIRRGGVMAMGIVPTTGNKVFVENRESLLKKLEELFGELTGRGVPVEDLARRTMITPACGTGLLDEEQALAIYRLTREVSDSFKKGVVS